MKMFHILWLRVLIDQAQGHDYASFMKNRNFAAGSKHRAKQRIRKSIGQLNDFSQPPPIARMFPTTL